MPKTFANLLLLLVSCVVGLALCEVSLRLFYPKYRHLAEAQFHSHARRIWAYMPNARSWEVHPDTDLLHPHLHNNLALRQHRDFSPTDLAAATNIGVFGDSFVENIHMDVMYSFTEPLDYLLNQSGTRFNVLSFGVWGYGPGQSFLHYNDFLYHKDIDYVVFVYCSNDLQNIYETGLYHLDDAGNLVENAPIPSSGWVRFISRLHLSYLLLDVHRRLSSYIEERRVDNQERRSQHKRRVRAKGGPSDGDLKQSLAIFKKLIRRWKHAVERNGNVFLVMTLPDAPINPSLADVFSEEKIEVIDLDTCFGNHDPAHNDWEWANSPYRFRNDYHWNEAGNKLAAVCLYRVLEEKSGIPALSEDGLQEALFRYYAAFGDDPSGKAQGVEGSVSLETRAEIREKYGALDLRYTFDFEVYLERDYLLYVKENCSPADLKARFFLHVTPVDEGDLPEHRRRYGFDNMGFSPRDLKIGDRKCVIRRRLPDYPIHLIRTGQHVKEHSGNYRSLWEEEFSMYQDTGGGERRAGN